MRGSNGEQRPLHRLAAPPTAAPTRRSVLPPGHPPLGPPSPQPSLSLSPVVSFARREYENYPEGEIAEMVSLYRSKGFSEEDADRVIGIYTSQPAYKEAFIDHMMVEELGYVVPRGDSAARLWLSGVATGLSFAGFGSLPLWMVAVLESFGNIDFAVQAGCGAAVTMVALFGLGICKVSSVELAERRATPTGLSLLLEPRAPFLLVSQPRPPAGQDYEGAQFHVVERPADDGQRRTRGCRSVSGRGCGQRCCWGQGDLHHRPRAVMRCIVCVALFLWVSMRPCAPPPLARASRVWQSRRRANTRANCPNKSARMRTALGRLPSFHSERPFASKPPSPPRPAPTD